METNVPLQAASVGMNRLASGLHGLRLAACQIPEKSGFPSGIRGAGPIKSGVLSAFLGTPAVG